MNFNKVRSITVVIMHNSNIPFPPGASVVAYLRDSGGEDQDLSTSEQQNALQEWCTQHNLTLSRIFRDDARPRDLEYFQQLSEKMLDTLLSDDTPRKRAFLKLLIHRLTARLDVEGNSAFIRGTTWFYGDDSNLMPTSQSSPGTLQRTHKLYSLSWDVQIR